MFMEPLKKLSGASVGPILIVIEALDESGEVETRRSLLRILAGTLEGEGLPKITELPSNFRILVTSRPLRDIDDEFRDAPHIRQLSMDDIPKAVSKGDIHTFVSHELKKLMDYSSGHVLHADTSTEPLLALNRLIASMPWCPTIVESGKTCCMTYMASF
jgi:hypothetical protein